MSLRQRLLLAVAGALLVSFLAGTWITTWEAARLVRAELSAALDTGRRGTQAALQGLAGPAPTTDALAGLVLGFDGSRHVLAELIVGGRTVARSHPAPVGVASPAWFAGLAAPGLPAVSLPVAGGAVLRLSPLPASETGERWSEERRLIGLLALSSALAGLLCFATAAWSLRWLAPLGRALDRLASGQAGEAVAEHGPPEIARLAAGFNRMQAALALAARENRRLSGQLDRIAEEERAELARDLHDEVGPLLFAITAWAAAARMQGQAGDGDAASASLRSLEAAAAELQAGMRDRLMRLRDAAPASTDLALSLRELIVFWQEIRPQTAFRLHIEDAAGSASEPAKAALFRVAQEGVSNAIRHGDPKLVSIGLGPSSGGLALTVQDDGAGGPMGSGLGLVGMQERLQAIGGTLDVRPGQGWTLTAWAPGGQPPG